MYLRLREQSRCMLDSHATPPPLPPCFPPSSSSYFLSQIRLFILFLSAALDTCSPGEFTQINFIWSLIMLRGIWFLSRDPPPPLVPLSLPLNPNITLPSPPQRCHFQSYFKTMCDYLWHCLTCAWRLSPFLSLFSIGRSIPRSPALFLSVSL